MLQYYTCVKVLKTMVFFKVAFHTCKYYSSLCGIIFIPQYPYMVLPCFFYLVLFSLYELSSLNHFIPWYRQSTFIFFLTFIKSCLSLFLAVVLLFWNPLLPGCCRAESFQECLELSQTTTERESEWEVDPWGGGGERRKQMCLFFCCRLQ